MLLLAGTLIGISITWVVFWAQQFGNTAYSEFIRQEMDKKREAEKKKSNP